MKKKVYIKPKSNGTDAFFKLNVVQFAHTSGNNWTCAGVARLILKSGMKPQNAYKMACLLLQACHCGVSVCSMLFVITALSFVIIKCKHVKISGIQIRIIQVHLYRVI